MEYYVERKFSQRNKQEQLNYTREEEERDRDLKSESVYLTEIFIQCVVLIPKGDSSTFLHSDKDTHMPSNLILLAALGCPRAFFSQLPRKSISTALTQRKQRKSKKKKIVSTNV